MSVSITDDIRYVGVNDHILDLFEGQYIVPNGMAYNSYVILDEKIAVMDSVDAKFGEEWMEKLADALEGRTPDYLVVQHMEPDHSANIGRFTEAYPEATVVASAKAFDMMGQFYGSTYEGRKIVIKERSTLELGTHTLTFLAAPMVHWPEVMMTYDDASKTFFTADAFGKFGALDVEEDWAARCTAPSSTRTWATTSTSTTPGAATALSPRASASPIPASTDTPRKPSRSLPPSSRPPVAPRSP